MSLKKLNILLNKEVDLLKKKGTAKGKETVITGLKPADGKNGPRYFIEGKGDKEFIRMNSNSYLGMSLCKDVIKAEEEAARQFGAGPGGVRFISGTYKAHILLEEKVAKFHGREKAMIFNSAYATSLGVIAPLTTRETIFISDELNHNCIIQAMRLSMPGEKFIYRHNNMADLQGRLEEAVGRGKRVLVVTDGVFSMRGDICPLDELAATCSKYEGNFEEGIITIVDDSHGVGALGKTGRGIEEYTNSKADILIGTLGKGFGVNGGYVTASPAVIQYLRETAPTYIYSNPITVAEAAAAEKAIDILNGAEGKTILKHLHEMTKKFETGLIESGYETIKGDHPVVPLMVRETQKTSELVAYLTENGILATGLNFPVVPRGDEKIRFQITADHTEFDIDYVLDVLEKYRKL
ncbi:MAG TPA: 7-keto-8-aminopelargonate synthetase [Desulfobacteraceae bacterium]|nr:7-keto-8-aminopelargonate synthetase [Desulfobacteraceae bacterium]